MSKKLKRFLFNYFVTAAVLGIILAVYEQVGRFFAGDYYSLVWWGIVALSVAIFAIIGWQLVVGIQSGRLLFDDLDD